MPYTNYTNRALTALMFGRHEFMPPEQFFVALSTTEPHNHYDDELHWNFTEPQLNGYNRVSVPNDDLTWIEAPEQPEDGYVHQNAAVITFPKALGPWGTVVAFGLFDDPVEGNLLGYGILEVSQTITNGDVASFPVGSLTITLL